MTRLEIYPSILPGEPIERHALAVGESLHQWLSRKCPSYRPGPVQPVTALLQGQVFPADQWQQPVSGTIELRPVPGADGVSLWVIGALFLGSLAVAYFLMPSVSTKKSKTGQSLDTADITANQPRLNQIIPEIAGRYKTFPDYLCQRRRYFMSATVQALDVMLCLGVGDYSIESIRIGETDVTTLGSAITYSVFEPGATVTGHPAHRNWYNSPEVGSTTSASGLALTAGTVGSATARVSASLYRLDGDAITIPPGAGAVPQDWEVGFVVYITTRIRTIEVVEGGGLWFEPNRDLVRGSFGDLGLAVNDIIRIIGSANEGRYRIYSLTSSVSEAGTPSTLTATKVAPLDFSATPITFAINQYPVTLNDEFSDVAALVAEINSQIAGVTTSSSTGKIVFTEDSPYSGHALSIEGYFELLMGASPLSVTGTATRSYDEMTLDRWVQQTTGYDDGDPLVVSGWMPAGSMTAGTFTGMDVQKTRIVEYPTGLPGGGTILYNEYEETAYAITALITGILPDLSSGVVGWEFQRLTPEGDADSDWAGFYMDTTSSAVSIRLDPQQIIGGWLGPFRATPASESTSLIEFDIFAPSGLAHVSDEGDLGAITRSFEVQWRANGGAWTALNYAVQHATRDQLGWTYPLAFWTPQTAVDIRVRRVGAESTETNILDKLEWYGLRSLLASPSSYAGVTTLALTVNDAEKIAGLSDQKINVIATRKLGGVATRAIDSWVRYVCTDIGYAAGDINETELTAMASIWTTRGDVYDYALVDQTTVKEELIQCLNAGFATLTIDQGQIRPARDVARSTFEHLYTPQNMTTTLKRKFTSYDPDDYNGVDIKYTSAITWKQETVECRLPGDTGTRTDSQTLKGVTDRTRAWRLGMRQRRIQYYRRKTYEFTTELDALNSSYLSYCALADDIPGYAQSALLVSLIEESDAVILESSEPLVWAESGTHVVALRKSDGRLSGPHPATRIDDTHLSIESLDFVPVTSGVMEPTHLLFGLITRWCYPVLVTEIAPNGDTVDVTAVNYDVNVYADDDHSPA